MNDEQYADWAAKIREDYPPSEANRIIMRGPATHQLLADMVDALENAERRLNGCGIQFPINDLLARAKLVEDTGQ